MYVFRSFSSDFHSLHVPTPTSHLPSPTSLQASTLHSESLAARAQLTDAAAHIRALESQVRWWSDARPIVATLHCEYVDLRLF
jgi:hypothetical protein